MAANILYTKGDKQIIMPGLYIQWTENVRWTDIDHGGNHARNRHIRKKSASRIRSG